MDFKDKYFNTKCVVLSINDINIMQSYMFIYNYISYTFIKILFSTNEINLNDNNFNYIYENFVLLIYIYILIIQKEKNIVFSFVNELYNILTLSKYYNNKLILYIK